MSDLAPCAHRTAEPKRKLPTVLESLPIYGCRWFEAQCADTPVVGEGVVHVCSDKCSGYLPALAKQREASE